MTTIKLVLVLTLLVAASGPVFAQSQPNYGPGGSVAGDTFGKPPGITITDAEGRGSAGSAPSQPRRRVLLLPPI
jgi:hypothetical protein